MLHHDVRQVAEAALIETQDSVARITLTDVEDPHGNGIDALLLRANQGDKLAEEELWSALYGELRRMAHAKRAPWGDSESPNTTAIVHEAYLRLSGHARTSFDDLGAFYIAAARAMRNILIDEIRRRHRLKRGGGARAVALEDDARGVPEPDATFLALDVALDRLERHDSELARIVHLRYFGGLSIEEICGVAGLSPATYHRRWQYAKSWLFREIQRLQEA